MIDLQTAHADDLLVELVRVRASVERLHAELWAEQAREEAVYAAIEAKADALASIMQNCEQNNQIETAVAGARRRSAK